MSGPLWGRNESPRTGSSASNEAVAPVGARSGRDVKWSLCRSCPAPTRLSPNTKKLQKRIQNYTHLLLFFHFPMPERHKDCGSKTLKIFVSKIAVCYNVLCFKANSLLHSKVGNGSTPKSSSGPGAGSPAQAEPVSWPPLGSANSWGGKVHRANKTNKLPKQALKSEACWRKIHK